jgi:hypothetical protein
MSETIGHSRLVGVILKWVETRVHGISGVCVFCDCPSMLVTEKPSAIEGFFPDLCVVTAPALLTILGEAKTLPDLESPRSYRQLVAFLRFLAVRPGPQLVMATPWEALATAKSLVRRAQHEASANLVPVQFLSDLQDA